MLQSGLIVLLNNERRFVGALRATPKYLTSEATANDTNALRFMLLRRRSCRCSRLEFGYIHIDREYACEQRRHHPLSGFADSEPDRDKGEQRSALVYLADYVNVERNTFTVANQWTIIENSEKRPDVIVFLNGMPVVVFELKSPSREETDASEAYTQLRNYIHEIPSLFVYNAFLVMSDLAISKAGSITAGEDRFME